MNDTDLLHEAERRDLEYHGKAHGEEGRDPLRFRLLGTLLSDGVAGDPALGDLIVAQGSPVKWAQLATGAAGTVFIGGSTFSANLLLSGYARIGSASAGNNVTAGDLTVVRLSVGNVSITANVEAQVNGDALVTGYMRVGSASNPTNVTAGDLTVTRLIVGDAALGSGVEAQVTGDAAVTGWTRIGSTTPPTNVTAGDLTAERILAGNATLASGVVLAAAGNETVTGWANVGAATAPSNTTAGDLTAKRGHFGTDGAFSSGKELEVVGDALVSSEMQIGGDLNHDGSNIGFFNVAVAARQTGGENVTNNVNDGGGSTAGVIPNFTDGVIWANDATNVKYALYQIARMLKQDHDALRAYGLLT